MSGMSATFGFLPVCCEESVARPVDRLDLSPFVVLDLSFINGALKQIIGIFKNNIATRELRKGTAGRIEEQLQHQDGSLFKMALMAFQFK